MVNCGCYSFGISLSFAMYCIGRLHRLKFKINAADGRETFSLEGEQAVAVAVAPTVTGPTDSR